MSQSSPEIDHSCYFTEKLVHLFVRSLLRACLSTCIQTNHCSDPLPFIILHKFPELVDKTTFVDVDYPQLMQKKRACIDQADDLKNSFPFLRNWTSKEPAVWQAGQYVTVGCDLRQLAELERILKSVANAENKAILFVAEVSVAYMDVKSADAVVSWASSFNDGALNLFLAL